MAFCKRCGNLLKENIKFCSKCGEKVSEGQKSEEGQEELKVLERQKSVEEQEELKILEEQEKFDEEKELKEQRRLEIERLERERILERQKALEEKKRLEERAQLEEEEMLKRQNVIKKPIIEEKQKIEVPKKNNKKGIIISCVIGAAIIAGGGIVYTFYDDILYKKYEKEIETSTSLVQKFSNYDKIIKLGRYEEVKEELQKLLKDDIENIKYVNEMENLKEEDKNTLKLEALSSLAEKKYLSADYVEAKEILDKAIDYGYNKEESLYKNITEYIDKAYETGTGPNTDTEQVYGEKVDMMFEDSDVRYLTDDELRIYTKEELALIRNEIYARRGYVFHQEPFKSHFKSKKWYVPNKSFKGSDSELNSFEAANVKLLLELEKER